MMDNPDVNCWPILERNNINITYLKAIRNSVTIIYGEEESEFVENIDNLKKYIPINYKFKILENANHSYEHMENQISRLIMETLKNA